ncbi:MAG: HEPN domain-containing protein [Deltaproteobacteria bacterium]|nr:HEPN domain-containing protein [Deltaproteobacteria bacterium]
MSEESPAEADSRSLTTIQDFFRLYIEPEVIRREALGLLVQPYRLHAAQVIWFAEDRAPQIRLNQEVRAMARAKIGRSLSPGDPIYPSDLEELEEVRLAEDDDPNAAHATLILIKGHWALWFDCTYNKARAANAMTKAQEFLSAAATALAKSHLAAFFDNLFSAAELAARAELLLTPDPGFISKTNHKAIHSRINKQSCLGNVSDQFVRAFNRLSELRSPARYSHESIQFDEAQCAELLQTVSDEMASLRSSRLREERSPHSAPSQASSSP